MRLAERGTCSALWIDLSQKVVQQAALINAMRLSMRLRVAVSSSSLPRLLHLLNLMDRYDPCSNHSPLCQGWCLSACLSIPVPVLLKEAADRVEEAAALRARIFI